VLHKKPKKKQKQKTEAHSVG